MRWLLIASRPAAPHTRASWQDAQDLARGGDEVTLLLTDAAVADAVVEPSPVPALAADGVRVLIDDTAAARRGVRSQAARVGRLTRDDEIAALLLDVDLRTVWR